MAIITCSHCGNPVSDKAERCPKCGHEVEVGTTSAPMSAPLSQRPPTYMIWAVLTTIFCCFPLGIVSIVKANKVNKLFDRGDYEGAVKASGSTKIWTIVTVACGIIFYIVLFFMSIIGSSES